MSNKHTVTFHKSGRGKAQSPADPAYPNGMKIDTGVRPSCEVKLDYPAPECGQFLIVCNECKSNAVVTAAGRRDDPISVTVPCRVIDITGGSTH
jgi:hypothetical protein